jgi:hypothetical protein
MVSDEAVVKPEDIRASTMAMGKRKHDRQPAMWVTTTDLPTAPSHPHGQHGVGGFGPSDGTLVPVGRTSLLRCDETRADQHAARPV